MRLSWLSLLTLVLGHHPLRHGKDVVTLDEFLIKSKLFVSRHMPAIKPIPFSCDSNLNTKFDDETPCYILLVNKTEPIKLHQAIFLTESDIDEANGYLDKGIVEVVVAFSKDPKCIIIQTDLEILKDTQVGPTNVTITQVDTDFINQMWKSRVTIDYKPLFEVYLKKYSIIITSDILNSIVQSTSDNIGNHYLIPENTSCTPYLQRFSIKCDSVSFRASYFRNNELVSDRWSQTSSGSPSVRLLPIDRGTYNYFKTFNGCIDLS